MGGVLDGAEAMGAFVGLFGADGPGVGRRGVPAGEVGGAAVEGLDEILADEDRQGALEGAEGAADGDGDTLRGASACKVRVTERSPSGTTGWGRSVEAEVESSEVGEEKEKRLAPVAAWPLLCSVAVTVVVAPGIREGISGEKERVSTGA